MRRKDREILDRNEIINLLDNAKVLHLGLIKGEFPHIVALHYGYEFIDDKLIFYMHSAITGEKLELIKNNDKCFIQLENDVKDVTGGDIPCKYGALYKSLMGRGKASIIEDNIGKIDALKILMKSQKNRDFEISEDMVKTVAVIKVEMINFSCKGRLK